MSEETTIRTRRTRGLAPLLRSPNRWRPGLFLTINLLGFITVNAFWSYLATGQWVSFSLSDYHRQAATPLGHSLLHPVSVLQEPWMILVHALVLGTVIFVPLVVSVLYSAVFSILFVAAVAVFGQAPGMALALALGSTLASRTRLRSDVPILAVLLGLIPAFLYAHLFGFSGWQLQGVLPLQKWVLNTPLIGAFVAAALAAGAVLWLGKLTRYRPGVVWPVLTITLATPMVVFFTAVGPAKLRYALLVDPLVGGDVLMQSVPLETWIRQQETLGRDPSRHSDQTLDVAIADDLVQRRVHFRNQAESYLQQHPDSPWAPDVLWVLARSQSLQVDRRARQVGLLKYDATWPVDASANTWQRLIENHPASPQAALARRWLAELALREGDLARADDLAHQAVRSLEQAVAELRARQAPAEEILQAMPTMPSATYYEQALFTARRIVWLIERNDALTNAPAAEALRAWYRLNPQAPGYESQLRRIADLYAQTHLGDNLRLAIILLTDDQYDRAELLIDFVEAFRYSRAQLTDAAVPAHYELGRLAQNKAHRPAIALVEDLKSPQWYFTKVMDAPNEPPNPWRPRAQARLNWIKGATQPEDMP